MKKIFVLVFALLLLISGALAATVSISPTNPTDSDDLTCLVNNQIQLDKYYEWYGGGGKIAEGNVLSNTLTEVGDVIVCIAFQPTPNGLYLPIGNSQVTILSDQQLPVNEAPKVNIPSEETIEDPDNKVCLNLNDYVTDDSTLDNKIKWEYSGNTQINVEIDSQKNVCFSVSDNVVIDFSETITFEATDEDGATGTDFIKINYIAPTQPTGDHAPIINFVAPEGGSIFSIGENIQFVVTATDEDGDLNKVVMHFPDGTSIDGMTVDYNFDIIGIYTVVAEAIDLAGHTATDKVTFYVTNEGIVNLSNVKLDNIKLYDVETYDHEANEFYRGGGIYLKFNLFDQTSNKVVIDEDIFILKYIADSTGQYPGFNLEAYSGNVGTETVIDGMDELGNYYYTLAPISLNDSALYMNKLYLAASIQGFGMIDDITLDIKILNNHVQFDAIPEITLEINEVSTINLADYTIDIEDKDSELIFTINIPQTNIANINFAGNTLIITGLNEGNIFFDTSVSDTDGSTTTQTITINVKAKGETGENENGLLAPVAEAGTWQEVSPNIKVTLDGSASYDPDGQIVSYVWSIDGVVIGTEIISDYTFTELGEYAVNLKVTDNDGLSDSDLVHIYVVNNPKDYDNDKITSDANAWPKIKNIKVANLVPLYPKENYAKGEVIPMYLKIRNDGKVDEKVQVQFMLSQVNGILKTMHNLGVGVGDIKIFSTEVPLPTNIDSGTYVMWAIVTDSSGIDEISDYWVITVL